MSIEPVAAGKALAYLRLALSTGWLAPNFMARVFGVDPEANPALPYILRLFAAREIYLATHALTSDGPERDRALAWGMGVDAADVGAALLAGARGTLPRRAALMAGGTALIATGLGYLARR